MLKSPENTKKYKPIHLFKANINNKNDAFFFFTESNKEFWMKQDPTDWEKVTIDSREILRDGGSTTYCFSGKEYDKLYVPISKKETPYISGNCARIFLKKIPLSKEILNGIDITKLDLSNISETIADAEKKQKEEIQKRDKLSNSNLSRLFSTNLLDFFDAISKDSEEISEPGTSFPSEQSAKGLSQLKI
ncbi:hypothetical protein [Rickettsiella endosymbiont of Rhagonycha lignosa]|uniref:hypothetical protein n=1 Tax=Rickettsiella endosymbiont of Rhagonycha lignosa TaxID=3077937 RepID=UPI00313B60B1